MIARITRVINQNTMSATNRGGDHEDQTGRIRTHRQRYRRHSRCPSRPRLARRQARWVPGICHPTRGPHRERALLAARVQDLPGNRPGPGTGGTAASREHPFQTFQWADYSAKPSHNYTYTVIPLYGTPTQLSEGHAVSVGVRTEAESGGTHSVWFNRGAIASQEYARQFLNRAPSKVANQAAYRWLSRGLLEAMLAFIGRARDASFGLHGAVYEFQWGAVLEALGEAADRGANVTIVYDAIQGGTGPVVKN